MSDHAPTDWRYKAGCRCDGCRKAHADYTRDRRAKSLAIDGLSHGRRATYDAGCRCDHCMTARQVAYVTVSSEYQPRRRRMGRAS